VSSYRILSIDGGGIRGIIPAIWLSRLQKDLDKPLKEYFDLIVGTSTGAIIAASVALGKDIEQCVKLYEDHGTRIFPRRTVESIGWGLPIKIQNLLFGPAYDEEPLGTALRELFAADTKLQAAKRRLLIPCYDAFNRQMFLMKSYEDDSSEIPVWEACKSSCSAPSYFPAHVLDHGGAKRPLVDGGVLANNPSMLAVAEALQISRKKGIRDFQKDAHFSMISLGTGNLVRKITIDEAKIWGAIQWLRPIIDVLFDASAEVAHHCARQIISPGNYERLQVELHGANDDMDDASESNVNALKALAISALEKDGSKEVYDNIRKLVVAR
jgi:uncharacterized protein